METNKSWIAKWVWIEALHEKSELAKPEIVYFRKTFDVPGPGTRLTLHVSADSRYRLFVNGHSVAVGPCKGDRNTHYYETVDVSEYLREGCNVLSAKVVHFAAHEPHRMGEAGPVSIFRSLQGAFLLEGTVEDERGAGLTHLKTDESWRCLRDRSTSYEVGEMGPHYMGYPELVEGALVPHGWENIEFDDSDWSLAISVSSTAYSMTGELTPWFLTERPIPMLPERRRAFSGITQTQGIDRETAQSLINGSTLSVPPRSRIVIELDAGKLSTGYLRFELSGGTLSAIRALCSECYEEPLGPQGERRKGIRDDPRGKALYGDTDSYRPAGFLEEGRVEVYEPFWFRTFRYVRLEITTAEEALLLLGFHYRETSYPLEIRSEFECSNEDYAPLWDVSLNTLRNCMHETYEDCPFYEQLQYTMDTMMQAIFTYNVSGDERLARKAIFDFHSSMLPNGMLQCRYPSVFPQVIPGFALYWIFMLRDHFLYYKDEELIVRYRPSMEQVLNWFDRQLTTDGIVGPAPEGYWSFVDWVEEWIHLWGVPTASEKGPITVYSFMYIAALRIAADLNERTGRPEAAGEYSVRAEKVGEAVRALCWSEERKMFRDGPFAEEYSQHTQIWAVISDVVTGGEARSLMKRTLADKTLFQVSFAMSYFLFRALSQADLYEESFPLWKKWTEQVEMNLTSWMEDPVTQRSDCHAWGAIPLYEFPAGILGVKPALPGFDAIRVSPSIGTLRWARGAVVTRHGKVLVDWRIEDDELFRITVRGPDKIPVEIVLPDKQAMFYLDAYVPLELTCRLDTSTNLSQSASSP